MVTGFYPPDWRELCRELADELHGYASANPHHDSDALVARARAALSQPERKELPADYIDSGHSGENREILAAFYEACLAEGGTTDEVHLRGLHAVLARFGGRPAPAPAGDHALRDAAQLALTTLEGWANYDQWVWPISARTAEALSALKTALSRPTPAPAGEVAEPVGPTLDDINEMCKQRNFSYYYPDWGPSDQDSRTVLLSMMNEAIVRWGRPAPPAEGEDGDLLMAIAHAVPFEDWDFNIAQIIARGLRTLPDNNGSADWMENAVGVCLGAISDAIAGPSATTLEKLSAPPAEGEVAELVADLRMMAGQAVKAWQYNDAEALTRAADLLERHAALVQEAYHAGRRDAEADAQQAAEAAEGEVAELVTALGTEAINCTCSSLTSGDLRRAAVLLERQAAPVPVAVSERLPEPSVKVLAHCFNDLGKGRTICAIWVPAKTRSDTYGDDDFTEYDEISDTFYWPEGWYETIENWDDLGYVKIDEGEVIYWQPLPKWPAHALTIPEQGDH